MSSLIEGYNYDIFISYRQKDNKGDMWVSKFVESLKTEIDATFKEDISVYFDENPHDRLQETHNVDKSLEDKLKCLIFIPILSQTYCDPKSYAWQSEFLPFLRMAEKDRPGRDVKLRNGNVASRILPIRIHDLEQEDIILYEKETGGVLRAIDFVFKTATGVSRPLNANEDHPQDNINKTFYADQINKAGHAIKEIIQGMKIGPAPVIKEKAVISNEPIGEVTKEGRAESPRKPDKRIKFLSAVAIIALLIVAAILVYPKIFKRNKLGYFRSEGEISVAVLPFQNMTNDTSKNFWQTMIQDNLINALSNSEELKVRQYESIVGILQSDNITNYASITPSIASNVSQRIDANVFIHGSINQVGSTIRLYARLYDSESEYVYQSFQIEGTEQNILHLADSLSRLVNNFLLVGILEMQLPQEIQQWITTNFPEAYKSYMNGLNAYLRYDWATARNGFYQALDIDSNLFTAYVLIASTYGMSGIYDQAKNWTLKLYNRINQISSSQDKLGARFVYARYFETPYEEIKYMKQMLAFDDQSPIIYWNLGNAYTRLDQHDNAITEYEIFLKIYKKWNTRPLWSPIYPFLGMEYHKTGQFKKEKKLYRQAERDFPDNGLILRRQAILALSTGKTKAANAYIAKLTANYTSEVAMASGLAFIYDVAGNLEKADEYYRQALSLEPENPDRINALAYFLIDHDLNINEGLELIDKALANDSENYNFLHTKGWGLYKIGAYHESIDILQKSWDIRREEAEYDHTAFIHLEEAKKAVVN